MTLSLLNNYNYNAHGVVEVLRLDLVKPNKQPHGSRAVSCVFVHPLFICVWFQL